ncbi:unnamed protein product [Symbiodinium sp. CCMP2456]|nr:unnamed protein product [Symbiodinium sp. CCMP2456]
MIPDDPTSLPQPPVSPETSEGVPVKSRPPTSSPLRPYASLNAERLKITGLGHWDPVLYLEGEPDLAMACLEPDVLLYGGSPPLFEVPSLAREDPAEIAALARKWDRNGLLYLKDSYDDQVTPRDALRVFNCYKNESCDRQIGDRRARNFRERALRGPSVGLPCGPALLGLCIDPKVSTFRICVTDRKDFYHQLLARPRKAAHNALFPPIPESKLAGTTALAQLHKRRAEAAALRGKPGDRGFGLLVSDRPVIACFQATCQGDHLGVEIATAAHRCLLKQHGLLKDHQEIRSNEPFPCGGTFEGLVIDDYYSISTEDVRLPPSEATSVDCLRAATSAYAGSSLLGSTEKDIVGADKAKVAGAEIDSTPSTRSLGVVPAGAPCAKRLSLASLTLSLAALPKTTDALHSCLLGGWVSALLYRRPLMSIFSHSFRLFPAGLMDPDNPKVIPLPRPVADELAVCAALAPLAVADLAAPWDPQVYATDSSDDRAAIVSAKAPDSLTPLLWRSSDRKGAAAKLLSRAQALLLKADPSFEEFDGGVNAKGPLALDSALWAEAPVTSCPRPVGFRFHFLQVGGTSRYIQDALAARGWIVGPLLDPAFSPHYDLCDDVFFRWLSHLLEAGKLDSILLSAPVPTFSSVLASVFSRGLSKLTEDRADYDLEIYGLESALVNDLALTLDWKVEAVWTWARQKHINCHETGAFKRLCFMKAHRSIPSRFASMIDSNVARCAISKGRSPSSALSLELRQIGAVSVAYGLFGALPFCPTRLMPADAPSREAPLAQPVPGAPLHASVPVETLAALPRLRRWTSNWVRLVLRTCAWQPPLPADRYSGLPALLYRPPPVDFDSSLGFPGEGTLEMCHDRTSEALGPFLKDEAVTEQAFARSCSEDVDLTNALLARYGRALYESGRPYNHYAETVNAVASRFPKIRRLLQPAWDVAFQWQRMEPHIHHQAMPWQVLLALVTSALLWGWVDVAGVLALAWGGLARIGEVFAAFRCDLVLPSDVQFTVDYILMAVRDPKTRNSAARHQALRLDQPQLMRVVELAFKTRHRQQKLWQYAPATFRSRFAKLVEAFDLNSFKDNNMRPLDLGSMRAGGATWLLHATENGEFVRRRGRWLNARIMEIYIQEVSSVLFLSKLQDHVADKVLAVMRLFPSMLEQAEVFMQFGFPPTTWFSLTAVGRAFGPV